MSYNGIGLKSAKGSSTSGHVQRSLVDQKSNNQNFLKRQREQGVNKKKSSSKTEKDIKKKDANILNHLSKRDIELQVSELQDKLEDMQEEGDGSSISDESIEKRCNELRDKLTKEMHDTERLGNAYKSREKREEQEDDEPQ